MTTIIEQPTFAELMDALRYSFLDSLTIGVTIHGVELNANNCKITVSHHTALNAFYCDVDYAGGKEHIRTSNIHLSPAQIFAAGVPKLRDHLMEGFAKELRFRFERDYVTSVARNQDAGIGQYSTPPADFPKPYDSLFTGRYLLDVTGKIAMLTLNILSQNTTELSYVLRGDFTVYDCEGHQLYNSALPNIFIEGAQLYNLRSAMAEWVSMWSKTTAEV